MSKKSQFIYQPKVAVYDLLNLVFKENSGGRNDAFYSSIPERRKRNRRTNVPDSFRSGACVADEKPSALGSARIAVLVQSLSDHHTNKIISGIETAAEKIGYEIAILNVLGKQSSLASLVKFEGFIACCSNQSAIDLDFLRALDKPGILVGNIENPGEYHCVKTDYQKGAHLAVNYLINKGCQKILMITSAVADKAACLDQYMGYRDALKESGRMWQEPKFAMESSVEAGMKMAAEMHKNSEFPDGVFISNDWIAAGFLKYLKSLEINLYAKTAVVGFGNESLCQMIEPALCSIDFRNEMAGSAALSALLEQIGGTEISGANRITVIEPALATRM